MSGNRRKLISMALALAVVLANVSVRAGVEDGLMLLDRGDFEGALRTLRPEADKGDPDAQYLLGYIYVNRYVDPPDDNAALRWLERAAENGHLQAQNELARMYRDGDGVAADPATMLRWYKSAALQGDVGAQLIVADIYAFGDGVKSDLIEAYAWYTVSYANNCAECHGEKGDGQGKRAYFMTIKPKDFLTDRSRKTYDRPHLFTGVAKGVLKTAMPAWSKVLTPQEMADVAEYVFVEFITANRQESEKPAAHHHHSDTPHSHHHGDDAKKKP